jgi:hypothetical protein
LIGGEAVSSSVQAGSRIGVMLTGSISVSSDAGAQDLIASVRLQGGFDRGEEFDAGTIIGSTGVGGFSEEAELGGRLISSSRLGGGVTSGATSMAADLGTWAKLQGGVYSIGAVEAGMKTHNMLGDPEGIKAGTYVGRQLKVEPVIIGGVYSSNFSMSDTDIASYYGDMFHNTSALEIASATQVLEIEVPIGDT